jgi:hypothetical protein
MMYGQSRNQVGQQVLSSQQLSQPSACCLYLICANTWLPLSLDSAGTPSSLLGQDVMLYSARTAAVPGYLCLDPNYGGNGGAAFMRPCDENNANHR